jgi:Flp pilus assembly pilin Flp
MATLVRHLIGVLFVVAVPQDEPPTSPHQEFGMKRLMVVARNFVAQEDGAALLEYGMLVLLIAVLCIVAVQQIGKKVSNGFTAVNTALP